MTNDLLEMPPRTSLFKEEARPEGPGSRLRRAREARRLTIEDVAKRLRYAPSRVEQLESDDYHAMGAPTFARGYLRSYAGQLNFSKEEILDILRAFDQLELGAAISGHKPQLIREEIKQINPKLARRIGYAVAALVVLLTVIWWYAGHSQATTVKPVENNAMATPAATEGTADGTAATPGQVQLEVVPLDGQGSATGASTTATTASAVSLPLPNLQPNRVSPTSRTPVQTPTQSTPQTTTTTTTTPAATTSTTSTKSTTKPTSTSLKNVPAPVVAKPGG